MGKMKMRWWPYFWPRFRRGHLGGWSLWIPCPLFAICIMRGGLNFSYRTFEWGIKLYAIPQSWRGAINDGMMLFRYKWELTWPASMEIVEELGIRRTEQLIKQYGRGPIPASERHR